MIYFERPSKHADGRYFFAFSLLLLPGITNVFISIGYPIGYPEQKNKHPVFHQMLGSQKYGGVAEIRTRASLATPNDLAKDELYFTAVFSVTIQPNLAYLS